MSLAAGSYASLAAHLAQPAKDDLGRVRAFFVWIAAQAGLQQVDANQDMIDALEKGGAELKQDTPLFRLAIIYSRNDLPGEDYAQLLADLCRLVIG